MRPIIEAALQRILLIVALGLTLCACQTVNGATLEDGIIVIKSNGTDIATGFFIDDHGTILTAYHAICGYDSYRTKKIEAYRTPTSGYLGKPEVIGYNRLHDIAILKLPEFHSSPLPIARTEREVSDAIESAYRSERHGRAHGFPDGKPLYRVNVMFNAPRTITASQYTFPNNEKYFSHEARSVPLIPFNGAISKGMSGGPIVVDGKVIGIISGTQAIQGDTFGWGIPTHLFSQDDIGAAMSESELPDLEPLTLIKGRRVAAFIKGMRFSDITELTGIEIVAIGIGDYWSQFNDDPDFKEYFDRGIKYRQFKISRCYSRQFLRDSYLIQKQHPNFRGDITFEDYLRMKNGNFTSKDMEIIQHFGVEESPTFIAFLNGKEVSRTSIMNWEMIKRLRERGENISWEQLSVSDRYNKRSVLSIFESVIDLAKKEQVQVQTARRP